MRTQTVGNYIYVTGVQDLMEKSAMLKYANEEEKQTDAMAVAEAMTDKGMDAASAEKQTDNEVLEIVDALMEVAKKEPEEKKKEIADETKDIVETVSEEKKAADKIAELLAKRAGVAMTSPRPTEVLGNSDKDYTVAGPSANAKGTGSTALPTQKGEIGSQENKEHVIATPKTPDFRSHKMYEEGKDIFGKDYAAPGKGHTTLPTQKGEIGSQENVETKLARLAMETTIAKALGK